MYKMISTNPFNKTNEELTEANMEDTGQFSFKTNLNLGELLTPANNIYNPFPELEEKELENYEGGDVLSFMDRKDKFIIPRFRDFEPVDNFTDMNVTEIQNDFVRNDALRTQINFLFSPQEGNTPEERAKSQQVNKLLAEIDNFAIQYRLSERQKEQLKTQVLSNHLGEYIQTKSNLERNEIERERAEALSRAKPDGGDDEEPEMPRDPTQMDEDNMRPDAQPLEDEDEEDTGGNSPVPETAGGAAAGTRDPMGAATGSLQGDDLGGTRILNDLQENSTQNPQERIIRIIKGNTLATLQGYVTTYNPNIEGTQGTTKNGRRVMSYLIGILGLGSELSAEEKRDLRKILNYVKSSISVLDT